MTPLALKCTIEGCLKVKAKGKVVCSAHRCRIERLVWKLNQDPTLVQVMAVAVRKWQAGGKGYNKRRWKEAV